MRRWFVFAALAAASLAPAPGLAAGFCTAQWAPVCGLKDGVQKTYSNVGCAKADDAEVVREGQCGDPTPKPTKTPIFCAENLPAGLRRQGRDDEDLFQRLLRQG